MIVLTVLRCGPSCQHSVCLFDECFGLVEGSVVSDVEIWFPGMPLRSVLVCADAHQYHTPAHMHFKVMALCAAASAEAVSSLAQERAKVLC